jgi:hypothetical protein
MKNKINLYLVGKPTGSSCDEVYVLAESFTEAETKGKECYIPEMEIVSIKLIQCGIK